jgi:hypothetical protein
MDISYTQSQRCSLRTSHGPLLIYTSTRCIGFALFRQGYEHIHYLIMFSFWYKPERCQQKAPAAVQFSKSNIQMIMIKPADRIDPQPTLRQPRSNRRQKPYRVEAAVNTQCDFPARKDRFQPQRVCSRSRTNATAAAGSGRLCRRVGLWRKQSSLVGVTVPWS